MELKYNPDYPSVEDLRNKAKKKMPGFAFEYLDGGCNEDVNLMRNTTDIREIKLKPYYLREYKQADLRTELFGHVYDAPFGICPIGLQGLMWPNSPEILAKAAFDHNIPFMLSTVTTSSIERIAQITEGNAWFQLYNPREQNIRFDLLDRAWESGYRVLAILSDVPTFGFRPRDIRSGLAMPPKMTAKNVVQMLGCPEWGIKTLIHGKPGFASMNKYMPKGLDMKKLGKFMDDTFSGRLSEDKVAEIRDKWKGKLIIKGVASTEDVEMALRLGLDGVLVSNHGGRQLDAGESAIHSLKDIVTEYKGKTSIMMDSGMRSGPDIARTIASGADFAFLGRTFMYAVGALGNEGGHHAISMLKIQLRQVLEQVCCEKPSNLPEHLVG